MIFGRALVGAGLGVGLRTNNQVATLERTWQESPQKMVAEELPRMQQVAKTFRFNLVLFGVLVVGLILHYFVPFDWARATGIMLVVAGGIGLLVDDIASRRAALYIEVLEGVEREEVVAFEAAGSTGR